MKFRFGPWPILALSALLASACAPSGRGVIVFCAGDSITEQAYPLFLRRLINQEGISARVLNYGRSGYTSGEYLNFLLKYRLRLIEEKPDFILLELGTNDLRADHDLTSTDEFRTNMKKIVGLFRSFRSRNGKIPKLFIATIPDIPADTPFPFGPESSRRVQSEINPAIRELAAAERITVVDQHAVFVGRPDLLPDVHPVRDGYRLMAETWAKAIRSHF